MLVAMVTNGSKARVSIGTSQRYIKKATESRVSLSLSLSLRRSVFGVSLWIQSESVYASACVSLHQWVSGIRRVQCSQ
jgi:hypothetical protein